MSISSPHMLNIVTAHRVTRWNGEVLSDIFVSRNQQITAAKETRDGSRLLAIADGRLVLIHDIHESIVRRRHTVLEASGQVQLLAFAQGSQELFFTTVLQNAIRRYSVLRNALRRPVCILPKPPCVLAVSSQYLIAGCSDPPYVCVQPLVPSGAPAIITALPSPAKIVCAALHPYHGELFLLAFSDTVLSLHKAGQSPDRALAVLNPSRYSKDSESWSLVSAKFLGSSFVTVVTIAENKTVSVFKFSDGNAHLARRWKTSLTPTCLSVLPYTDEKGYNTLAIGMHSSEVAIYDDTGVLKRQIIADVSVLDIIDLEWTSLGNEICQSSADMDRDKNSLINNEESSGESSATVIISRQSSNCEVSENYAKRWFGRQRALREELESGRVDGSATESVAQEDVLFNQPSPPSEKKRDLRSSITKYTWKPPIISSSATVQTICDSHPPGSSRTGLNTSTPDGAIDTPTSQRAIELQSQPSRFSPPRLFQRFRSSKQTTSQETPTPPSPLAESCESSLPSVLRKSGSAVRSGSHDDEGSVQCARSKHPLHSSIANTCR